MKYAKGRNLVERIFDMCVPEPNSGCWIWEGKGAAGKQRCYGVITVDGRTKLAHRVAYETLEGPIPEGLTLDHRCRNTFCVNPAHLEPVTNARNNQRKWFGEGFCKRGHAFTPENTVWQRAGVRLCRECDRERAKLRMRRTRAAQRRLLEDRNSNALL